MMKTNAALIALALAIGVTAPLAEAATKAKAKKAVRKPVGRTETLACRLGTEDRHARIAVVVIRGKTDSFAYYSKWKPRTCSIYLQRNRDGYSQWADNGNITTINLEKGVFLIEHKPSEYHFVFRDVDRERYCGMDGVINGGLTIKRGKEQCELDGEIMAEGTALGEAHAKAAVEVPEPAAGASDVAAAGAAAAVTAVQPETTAAAAAASAAAPAAPAVQEASTKDAAASPAGAAAAPASAEGAAATTTAAASSTAPSASPENAAAPLAKTGVTKPDAPAGEAKAEAPRKNPISAFFRSLKPTPPEEQGP